MNNLGETIMALGGTALITMMILAVSIYKGRPRQRIARARLKRTLRVVQGGKR